MDTTVFIIKCPHIIVIDLTYIYMYNGILFHALDVYYISPGVGSYGGGTLITLYGQGVLVHSMICTYVIRCNVFIYSGCDMYVYH